MVDKRTIHVYVEFEAKFGELWHQEKHKSHAALRNRCCIDTKRCSGGYTQPQVVRLRGH